MSFSFSSRCILIMGDEGIQIYSVDHQASKFIDFIAWDNERFQQTLAQIIVRKCKKKSVVVLNDMVEQHYRKERIPNVGLLDKGNVLKRRLSVAFPNYKVRAALKLKDKKAVPDGKGGAYLFAAIPASEVFTKTLAAVRLSGAPLLGFYLLPVEGAAMVRSLSSQINKGKRGKAAWTIFMGQHYNGGLRQVVIRNGELALTRVTPIVDTDVEPDLWAKEIASELNGTMSYLARLGYKEGEGLDIVVVANNETHSAVEESITTECNLKMMNSEEMASVLKLKIGPQDDLRYADPLYASYVGKIKKFQLPMSSPLLESLMRPRRIASYVMVGLICAGAYFGYNFFQRFEKSMDVSDRLTVAIQQNKSLAEEYKLEIDKKKAIGFDFLYVSSSIELFTALEEIKLKPLEVAREVGRSLGPDLFLDKLLFKLTSEQEGGAEDNFSYDIEELDKPFFIEAVMTISFPSTIDPDIGVKTVKKFQERLKDNLPTYDVKIIRQVADLSYTGNFVGGAGAEEDQEPEDYIAEVQVRKKLK